MSGIAHQPYDLEIAAQLYDAITDLRSDLPIYTQLAHQFGGPVLELACGTGRCVLALIREGFDVVGVDVSEPMLRRLRDNLDAEPDEIRYRASYIRADDRWYALPVRFGMAFIAANSFLHLVTKADQMAFLNNAFEHLRPGGILAIDIFNPDLHKLVDPTDTVIHTVGDIKVVQQLMGTDAAEQTRTVVTSYTRDGARLARVEWTLRYVFRYELEHLLERAGFDIIHLWGDYEQRPFGEATERLFAIGQKPGRAEPSALAEARAVVAEVA